MCTYVYLTGKSYYGSVSTIRNVVFTQMFPIYLTTIISKRLSHISMQTCEVCYRKGVIQESVGVAAMWTEHNDMTIYSEISRDDHQFRTR